ncbi:MAG: ABC transporter permease subunit, partial [Myxococcota bacterium]|nr:ABC transporter permease subunit [Myxococcota bacterium]
GICIGRSFQGLSVQEVALPAFAITLSLAASALFSCFLICLALAIWTGGHAGPSRKASVPLYILTSAPCFVAAVLLIQSVNYGIHHYIDQAGYVPPIWHPLPGATDSIVPSLFAGLALVIGDGLFMEYYNALSAQVRQVKQAQFIAAIRAKGAALFPHIAKNLVVPFMTGFSARLPLVLGSAVIVEYIFTLEGAGYALLEAAKERDFPLVVGLCVLFTATVVVLGLVVDIVRALVDPREVSRGA